MVNIQSIINSWNNEKYIHTLSDILEWVKLRNRQLRVDIKKTTLSKCFPWHYDENSGCIKNEQGAFFKIYGINQSINGELISQQPIMLQNEIGYLGILVKIVDDVAYFLMQAKIEPGNINKIQISPTLQATKSNFTQKHGGGKPAYLKYFLNAKPENIIVDQIQSEQSSRFLGKRNRNVIVITDDDIDEGDNFRWMTLGQIKKLMRYDNLINMDTRTVISCLPFSLYSNDIKSIKSQNELPSINSYVKIFNYFNDYKMHNDITSEIVSLNSLKKWHYNDKGEFVCENNYPFKMVFCDISIEGREVRHWCQPCFEAEGIATFGLIFKKVNGLYNFLVKAKPEIGCFDKIELAPTVQIEYGIEFDTDIVTELFFDRYKKNIGVNTNVLLSEEGGRFYHEQNRNILLEIKESELIDLPDGYFWCTYTTLNMLCQVNNVLNIQLRNLLSLFEGDF